MASPSERRALRIEQDGPAPLYLFSLAARDVADVADVARIGRDDAGRLIGSREGRSVGMSNRYSPT